jgi:heme-degrading monooxygenase HmoA
MAVTYTSAIWTVKEGHEDDFVAAWEDFVRFGAEHAGSGMFHMTRDVENPRRYFSYAPWESSEAITGWTTDPQFPEKIGRVRAHCDDFERHEYELVTKVEGAVSIA